MKKIVALLVSFSFTCGSCEKITEGVYSIKVNNKSSQTINVYAAYILPDTALSKTKPLLKEISSGKFADMYDSDVNDPRWA